MQTSNPHLAVIAELPGLKLFSDGSFDRHEPPHLSIPPSPQALLAEDKGIASKDAVLDNHLGLWVRIYCPLNVIIANRQRLPVCLYFHGGGFCTGSASWQEFHTFCISMAAATGAVVVSVNYRLAPEHRLPAAYDDCSAALSWLLSGGGAADPWLHDQADLSKVFLIGDSAGGNIVHHLGIREAGCAQIRGLVMVQPSFTGEERTASEAESPEASKASDMFRRMSLPVGANRDHAFSNPLASQSSELFRATLPPTLLVVGGRDIMRDRQTHYYRALKSCGKEVRMVSFEEEDHGFYARKPEAESTESLLQEIARFVNPFVHPLTNNINMS